MSERFSVAARLASFGHALRGIGVVIRTEHNAWIHLAATLSVVALGLGLGVGASDWAWLIAASAAVWIAESLNTAIERLADASMPDVDPLVRDAKDAAAAAVLIAAVAATAIGLIVLGPPLVAALTGASP